MNKSDITNIVALLFAAYGYSNNNDPILMMGLFALSGAITNMIAIHMLFEKVPFLYGSGVIENKFLEFKKAIHDLMMDQFFTKEHLKNFFKDETKSLEKSIDLESVLKKTDLSPVYEGLKDTIMQSSFSSLLSMVGGEKALEPLKKPFIDKMKNSILDVVKSDSFNELMKETIENDQLSEDVYKKLSKIVNSRLDELTPKMVKNIIQKMIREHLGWLVVWGGVFGGLIGLILTLIV